jgi:hypothetical protein
MRYSSKWMFVVLALVGLHCAPTDPAPRKGNSREVKIEPETPKVPDFLKDRIEAALEHVRRRDLLTTHGFWTIFHGILGLGPETTTLLNLETGQRVNAMDYIAQGNSIRGMIIERTADGLDVKSGQTFVAQGHQDQFIAEMVQWGLPASTKFTVGGKAYTFMDFLRHAKMRASVAQKQELSWAILVIGQHFGTDIAWTNSAGEQLRFEDIVRYELNEPIDSAACGGTHRLFGLTWVLHLHRRQGGKLEGVWKDVAAKLEEHKRHAKKHRNADGSFSTDYFKGPGNIDDNQLRISTTGHILEWLSLYLPDSELKEPWMQEAASTLAKMILESHLDPVEGGALYHAAHGLHMYHSRVFGDPKASRPFPLPLDR